MLDPFRTHATTEDLIGYRDGELPAASQARVRKHLEHCDACRKEALLLEDDLVRFDELTQELGPELRVKEGLVGLQKTMEEHGSRLPPDLLPKPEVRISPRRLASVQAELTIYLGAQAAQRLLARAHSETAAPQDLVDAIEPLMVGLLGNRGGSAVAGKVALLCGTEKTSARRPVT